MSFLVLSLTIATACSAPTPDLSTDDTASRDDDDDDAVSRSLR